MSTFIQAFQNVAETSNRYVNFNSHINKASEKHLESKVYQENLNAAQDTAKHLESEPYKTMPDSIKNTIMKVNLGSTDIPNGTNIPSEVRSKIFTVDMKNDAQMYEIGKQSMNWLRRVITSREGIIARGRKQIEKYDYTTSHLNGSTNTQQFLDNKHYAIGRRNMSWLRRKITSRADIIASGKKIAAQFGEGFIPVAKGSPWKIRIVRTGPFESFEKAELINENQIKLQAAIHKFALENSLFRFPKGVAPKEESNYQERCLKAVEQVTDELFSQHLAPTENEEVFSTKDLYNNRIGFTNEKELQNLLNQKMDTLLNEANSKKVDDEKLQPSEKQAAQSKADTRELPKEFRGGYDDDDIPDWVVSDTPRESQHTVAPLQSFDLPSEDLLSGIEKGKEKIERL